MKKSLFFIALLVGAAIFFSWKRYLHFGEVTDIPAAIITKPPPPKKEIPAVADTDTKAVVSDTGEQIKDELINPSLATGPKVSLGSRVKLEYKIKNAKTGVVIAETPKKEFPTDFQIGNPNIFGDLLLKFVGSTKGAKLKFTLPPKFGILTATGRELSKGYSLSDDTTLLIEFYLVEVIPHK